MDIKEPTEPSINRVSIMQYFIDKYNFQRYLEIGIFHGITFGRIKCSHKDGVDPVQKDINERYGKINDTMLELIANSESGSVCERRYLCTSDEFFSKHIEEKYDIIFIDGLHQEHQVDIDLKNSMKWLNKYGVIICHDSYDPDSWNRWGEGQTVWRSISKFNHTENGWKCYTFDTDYGVSVIAEGIQNKFSASIDEFRCWETKQLNLVPPEKFYELF